MSTRNPDQLFRLAYVTFRFVLLVSFTALPFGGLVWWKTGSLANATPIVAVILLVALAVSFLDYAALGKKMHQIEAKKQTITESNIENKDASPIDASNPPPGA